VIQTGQVLTGKISGALPSILSEHCWIYCEPITIYHIPDAVNCLVMVVPKYHHCLIFCEDASIMNLIHKCAIVIAEEQSIIVSMKIGSNSITV
jgi:hypothetical protein